MRAEVSVISAALANTQAGPPIFNPAEFKSFFFFFVPGNILIHIMSWYVHTQILKKKCDLQFFFHHKK